MRSPVGTTATKRLTMFRLILGFIVFSLTASGAFAQYPPALSFGSTISYPNETGYGASATVDDDILYVAFQSNNGDKTLHLTTSSDGINFLYPDIVDANITMDNAPSIALFNNQLYIAYESKNQLYTVIYDGSFRDISLVTTETINGPPTLTVYNGQLLVAFVHNLNGSNTYDEVLASSDGQTWSYGPLRGCGANGFMPQTGAAEGITAYNGALKKAWQSQGGAGSHVLWHCATDDPAGSQADFVLGSGVTFIPFNGYLYLIYKDNTGDNYLETGGPPTYDPPVSYPEIRVNGNNEITPGAVVFRGDLYVFYVSNDSSHNLDVVRAPE